VVVAADGSGDFTTVQGAIDWVPDRSPRRVTVFIRNGNYEEIVYFRNKSNMTIQGEDRDKVVVFYANNEVFNPHPSNISTNEWPGTFRRAAAFAGDSTGSSREPDDQDHGARAGRRSLVDGRSEHPESRHCRRLW
jgi:pectin methylesterase-like acyl-CoA thioesterase